MLAGALLFAGAHVAAQPLPGGTPQPLPQPRPGTTVLPVPGGVAGQIPQSIPRAVPQPTPVLAGRDEMLRRMRDYIAQRGAQLLPRAALTQAGLSPENDAVEQGVRVGGVWMAPHHVGLAGTAAPPSLTVDPAALEGARAAARRRVGHDPTEAEVAQDLAAFDQAIARINQGLAERQAAIAAAYKQTGRFPDALEPPLLGGPRPTATLAAPSPADRAALQRVFTILLSPPAPPVPVPR